MLEAVPKSFFSSNFDLRSSGQSLAVLDVSLWRERAEFVLDGIPHRLYREGMLSGDFVLERAGSVIARAVKPSAFRARFEVNLSGRPFTLQRLSIFSRRFGIFSGDQQVGLIRPAAFFTQRAVLELPSDWPAAIQLYVFWLTLLIWKRDRRAAAAS